MKEPTTISLTDADRNWRRFVLFRVLFNSRFYYPVLAVLFLDLGLSPTQYSVLNFAWALAIVFTDLPAGVLADRIGRKPLIVAASFLTVAEMLLLCVAPLRGGVTLVVCCLANRVLSGMAEGMASGADEALVFDSLAERGRTAEWPSVLDQVMRWQGVGMIIAMIVGGAVYDPAFMERLFTAGGLHVHFIKDMTVRFPLYLNLAAALVTVWVTLGLREPGSQTRKITPGGGQEAGAETTAWRLVFQAGKWIVRNPAPLFVILAGVLIDCVARVFLNFSSSYCRMIELPEATFGLVGALMGGLGLLISPVARRMVSTNTMLMNFLILATIVFASLLGVTAHWAYWGTLYMVLLAGAMIALSYVVSYYLNALVASHQRATVLSFKGLAFNLGYGFLSLVFALALRAGRAGGNPERAVAQGFAFLPWWLLGTGVVCALFFHQQRGCLAVVPSTALREEPPEPVAPA